MLTSITRQCTEVPSPEISWTIAVLPSPIGVAAVRAANVEGHRPREEGSRRRRGGSAPSMSPTSRLRPLVDVRQRRDVVAVDDVLFPEELARGGVEDRHDAGPRTRRTQCRRTAHRRDARCRWTTGAAAPGARVGRRRFAGGGVDEPDPSLCPCRRASDRPPAARPGRCRRARTPRRRRPGSSAADTCPPPTGPRCAASSRRRRRRPGHCPG